jgi:pantothenate kinase-related protein Tda10
MCGPPWTCGYDKSPFAGRGDRAELSMSGCIISLPDVTCIDTASASSHRASQGKGKIQSSDAMRLPPSTCRYDKSAFAGRGDRAEPSTWPSVSGPVELVFFEGWMLGFKPVGVEAASGVEAALGEVDRQLAAYQEAWDSLVDSWLVIRISDPQVGWTKWRGGWGGYPHGLVC